MGVGRGEHEGMFFRGFVLKVNPKAGAYLIIPTGFEQLHLRVPPAAPKPTPKTSPSTGILK